MVDFDTLLIFFQQYRDWRQKTFQITRRVIKINKIKNQTVVTLKKNY
jgi:hypothetical protein